MKMKEQINVITPEVIKEIRYRLGMEQKEFADYIEVSLSSLSKWEAGFQKPGPKSYAKLFKLAKEQGIL